MAFNQIVSARKTVVIKFFLNGTPTGKEPGVKEKGRVNPTGK